MLKVSLCHRLEVLKNLYIFQQKLFLSSRDGLVHWNGDFARHWNQFFQEYKMMKWNNYSYSFVWC